MGLFREAGRQVEQIKQAVSTEDDAYECTACETQFDTHDGECPECGSSEIAERAE